jgi:RND family efflux transporter MFP subunit
MIKLTTLVFTIAFSGFLLQGCNLEGRADIAAEPYLHRVETRTVRFDSSYDVRREFAGEIKAGQSSELGFEFPGQLEELYVDEGDYVVAGQLLAQQDTGLLGAERDELAARRAELQAELETAQRNLERVKRLQSDKLASERELDDLAGRTRVLQASLQRVDAALQANSIRFEKSELRAPFDADIARRLLDSGVVVNAGQAVFSLVDSGVREVRAGVPANMADRMAAGDLVSVRAGKQLVEGLLIAVGPVVDQATRSRVVRVRVADDLPPGGSAYLQIGVPMNQRGAWIPDAAVTEGVRGTWVVYAAQDSGDNRARLESRSVVIHHARGNELFVSGALEEGDRVVTSGLHRLAPGQLVRTGLGDLIADAR